MTVLPRRKFLALFPAALAAHLSMTDQGTVCLGCQTNAWNIDSRDFSTFLAVLEKIKRYQFDGFETSFANVEQHFHRAKQARKQIAQTGLRFFGVHIFLLQYDPQTSIAPMDLYQRVVDGASRLDAERLILSGASVASEGRLKPSAFRRKVNALARAANYARRHGMRLAYHNEIAEFVGDGMEMQALLRQTDPDQIDFLLDAGHAFEAGADTVAFFAQHHSRIAGLHLRDYRGKTQVPLGQGDFDLPGLAAAIQRPNWRKWVLVEEERPNGVKLGEAAVGPARATLQRVFGR